MHEQLRAVGADVEEFKSISPSNFACVKFKTNNLEILDQPRKFSHDDPAITSDYYNLKNIDITPQLENLEFIFKPGHKAGKKRTNSSYEKQKVSIDLVHNQIQTAAFEQLASSYGDSNVGTEQETGQGTKIDIVVRTKKSYIFYEIKTANSIKSCIRESLSQLMEYAYYPKDSRATKLVIISPNEITPSSSEYLKVLRERHKIPIYYQQFDMASNALHEKLH